MLPPGVYNLAKNLESYNVDGWYVESKIPHKPSTGGFFSTGYIVKNHAGVKGFLKALDYSSALFGSDAAVELQKMTTAYNFERELLEKCCNRRLHYVVKIIDSGHFELPQNEWPAGVSFCTPIDYLILEFADTSIRNLIDLSEKFDYAWALRSLHNVAVGISEMHSIQLAHQDIKPSNVLVFRKESASKLGDVGRASSIENPSAHDLFSVAGDCNYSPFEQLYGEDHPDWKVRRYSCDMFMFGNLIMTYFNNVSITTAVLNKLTDEQHYQTWGDTYQAVLPYVEAAFAESVEQFNQNIDEPLRLELMEMIRQLCNPDVMKRGDLSKAHLRFQQYSLERYISRLDFWARKYELSFEKVI